MKLGKKGGEFWKWGKDSRTKKGEVVWEGEVGGAIWKRVETAWVCIMRLSWWTEAVGGLRGMFATRWIGQPKWVKNIEREV